MHVTSGGMSQHRRDHGPYEPKRPLWDPPSIDLEYGRKSKRRTNTGTLYDYMPHALIGLVLAAAGLILYLSYALWGS